MSTSDEHQPFDRYYFEHGCGRPYQRDEEWMDFFGKIAERIVQDINPNTVLDAGCALGFLVESLRERGVEAFGIDISEYAIQNVHKSVMKYCKLGSIADTLPMSYDLIVCIEVLEHMPRIDAEKAITNFCVASNDVLFSSTPYDYKETTHFNVQPPEVWAEQFARHEFYRDIDFDTSFITNWAVRFIKNPQPAHRLVRGFERRHWIFSKENTDLRTLVNEMRGTISKYEEKLNLSESTAKENEVTLEELRGAVTTLEQQIVELRLENDSEIDRLSRELEIKIKKISKLQENLNQSSIELEDQGTIEHQLRGELDTKDGEIRLLEERGSALEKSVAEWSAKWNEVESSMVWTLFGAMQKIRVKLAPQGSRRHRFLHRIFWGTINFQQRLKARLQPKVKDDVNLRDDEGRSKLDELQPEGNSLEAKVKIQSPTVIRPSIAPLMIALYTTDQWYSASARLRLIGPAEHESSGVSLVKGSEWNDGLKISLPDKIDGLVIQRDFPRYENKYKKVVEWARSSSKFIIYEIDDLLIQLPLEHPEYSYYEEARRGMIDAIEEADAVIVCNIELSEIIRKYNKNIWVLPNYLDDQIWHINGSRQANIPGKVIVGYMGGITKTHMPDLEMIVPLFQRMLKRYPNTLYLRFWGLVHPDLAGHPNVEYIEDSFPSYPDFANYFIEQKCDVFVAPLVDNLFNRCKSSIKYLEYSALGVPGVYSMLPPYMREVIHGENGFLASSLAQWEDSLTLLLSDYQLRVDMGQKAKHAVIKDKLLSNHAHEWGSIYRSAIASAR